MNYNRKEKINWKRKKKKYNNNNHNKKIEFYIFP